MKKKLISTLLSASMLLSMVSINAFALEGNDDSDASRFGEVLVSNEGSRPTIDPANTARKLAVAPDGTIYATYHASEGVYVAKSTDEGKTFSDAVVAVKAAYEGLANNSNVEIAVSSTGIIYLGWADTYKLYLAKSTDSGKTFSPDIKTIENPSVKGECTSAHMAVDGDNIYMIRPEGTSIYISNNSGDDFHSHELADPSDLKNLFMFSDLHVDSTTHRLIVQEDMPVIKYYTSDNNGAIFSDKVQYGEITAPGQYDQVNSKCVFFSVGAFGADSNGKYLLIGGQDDLGYKINLDTEEATDISIGSNSETSSQGRSLGADNYGNLVTGYANDGTQFQWQKTVNGMWVDIPGLNSSSGTISNLTKDDYKSAYRCKVTIAINGVQHNNYSPVGFVGSSTPDNSPIISDQPTDTIGTSGETATFNIFAYSPDNINLNYQWQKLNGGIFENIAGANSPNYTTNELTDNDNNNEYRCVVSSESGTTISNSATLTIAGYPKVADIYLDNTSLQTGSDGTATLRIGADNNDDGTLSYQWQELKNDCWNDIESATEPEYTTTTLDDNVYLAKYRCKVTNTKEDKSSSKCSRPFEVTAVPKVDAVLPSVDSTPEIGRINDSTSYYINITYNTHGEDSVYFITSHDMGTSFSEPTKVAVSSAANADINTTNGDILFLYERDSNVYLRVYGDRLTGYNLGVSTSNLYFNADDESELTQTVTITNKTSENMPISGFIPSDGFTVDTDGLPESLAPNQSYDVKLTYTGDRTDTKNGTLTINYEESGSKIVNLTVGHTETVTALSKPTITKNPEDTSVDVGSNALFSVIASSTDEGTHSYQWQSLEDGVWTDIESKTDSTYIRQNVSRSDDGKKFRCIVTSNKDGEKASTTSAEVTLTIKKTTVGISWGNTEFIYSGQPICPRALATGIGDSECNVTVEGAKTEVGENYIATATSLSNSDFVLPSEGTTTTFKITPADINSFRIFQTEALTYNGAEQSANFTTGATTVDGSEVTFSYSTSVDGPYTTELPKFKDVGTHSVYFKAEAPNHNTKHGSVSVKINPSEVAAPQVTAVDETISMKKDGMILGLSPEMEVSTSPTSRYTSVTDPNMQFESGTYYVRYKATEDHDASAPTTVTINKGRKLKVNLPTLPKGYTVTASRTELDYDQAVTFDITFNDGYGKGSDFEVNNNGTIIDLADTSFTLFNVHGDINIRVKGVVDIDPPDAQIHIGWNIFTTLLNRITFDTYFKETQQVSITANDNDGGSGLATLQYYLANSAVTNPSTITDWVNYTGSFNINPNNKYIIYVKAQDNDGNVKYISSNGLVLDNIAPTIAYLRNGETYYGSKPLRINRDDTDKVYIDDVSVDFSENDPTIRPDNKSHTVKVVDKAGNFTEYTINVYKIYNVSFVADGNTISTTTVNHGDSVTPPEIPAKTGYDQVAPYWDKSTDNITGDTTFTAVYTKNTYDVEFKVDGQVVDTKTVSHGDSVTPPEIPSKTGYDKVAPYWDTSLDNITGKTTITAVYTKNTYDVEFKVDGQVVDTKTVSHGDSVTPPEIPTKTGYDKVAPYWDKSTDNITGDTTFTAVYTKNTYDVEFKVDGQVVDTKTVSHGDSVTPPEIPSKTGYDQVAPYWDTSLDNITGDTTFTAVYTKNTYDVEFKVDGQVVDTKTVSHGDSVTPPEIPSKTGYDQVAPYWDKSTDNITGDTTFTAVYTKNTYDVEFKVDGQVVDTKTVSHGDSVTPPEIPSKTGYDQVAPYWDKSTDNITGDTTFTAVYTKNTYDVEFIIDGQVVDTKTVSHGESVLPPLIPSKTGYDKVAPYWDTSLDNITGKTTITAVYTKNDEGTIKDTTPDTNHANGKISNSLNELKSAVPLTEEESKAITQGEDMHIFLIVKDVTKTVNTEDKQKAESILKDNQKLGMYLDVSLFKQIGSKDAVKIPNTNGIIKVSFKVPDEFLLNDNTINRIYKIVRVHNGVPSIIDAVYNENDKSITFETDKFSTYALIYTDTDKNNSNKDNNSNSSDNTTIVENPKTSSQDGPLPLLAILTSSLLVLGYEKTKKRK